MVGIPGSGKTTLARQRFPKALRISLDDLRLMFTGRTFDVKVEPAVAVAADALKDSLALYASIRRIDLIHDATNVSRSRRAVLIATAHQHNLSPVAVYLPVPLKLALSRNQQRPFPVPTRTIVRFHRNLEPPTLAEGFDDVIVVEAEHDVSALVTLERRRP